MVGAARRLVRVGLLAALAVAAALPGCASDGAHASETVEASDYDSFWLWAGVHAQPVLATAKRLYLLEGEVERGPPVRLVSRRPAVPRVQGSEVWLVVRAETLAWPPQTYETLTRTLTRWRAAGNRVVGVQIDFDARTRKLATYARFLSDLRRRLPPDCRLGVTGLLDWSANGDPVGLAALSGSVDEVVLQIYQGRHVIPGYAGYLAKLDRLRSPFRIGLLQGGEWTAPAGLVRNPYFEGYVVFLHNDRGSRVNARAPGK